jgi:DNA-binding NtrC family response regulator
MTWLPATFQRYRDAVRRGDTACAGARYEHAIDAYTEAMVVRGGDLTPDQEADLRARIANCYLELGNIDSADVALAPAERLDASRVLPGTRGAVLTARARVFFYRGQYEETVREANRAWVVLRGTGENELVARGLTFRGHGYRRLGRLEEARDDYTDAMAAARRAGNDHEVGLAASNLGFLLWQTGRYHEARSFHRRAVEIHEGTRSEAQLTRELFALSVGEFHCGNWPEVEVLLTRCEERAQCAGDRRLIAAIEIARARFELYRGQDPRERLENARQIAEEASYGHDLVVIGQLLGEAAMERGDWAEARRVLLEAYERAKASSPAGEPSADTVWRLALAEDALGDPHRRVLSLLESSLKGARARELSSSEAFLRRALGESLARRGRAKEARVELEQALATFRELKMPFEIARTLAVLANVLAATLTEASRAPQLFREAQGIFTDLGAEREAAKAAEGLAACGEVVHETEDEDGMDPFAAIVTSSAVMELAIERARRIAASDLAVLVTGETGTGKELFARAIHRASKRAGRPFLAVNCAALSETLLEAELFGHVKGAFTGAVAAKAGIFEAANGGTVFLDEVGKAPLSLQAKLLRVVDTGELRRVGGVEAIRVNVRIVAATNRDLIGLVDEGRFLPDLFYRLRGFEITVPPLRQRGNDVALLFERFAGREASESVRELLEAHEWPGNVRELRNLAEGASFLTFGRGPITLDALPDWIREISPRRIAKIARLEDTEKDAVLQALEKSGGNRSRAARELGISRQTLYTKMSKFGIGRANAA